MAVHIMALGPTGEFGPAKVGIRSGLWFEPGPGGGSNFGRHRAQSVLLVALVTHKDWQNIN